jgi:N-acetylglucosamine malate deacetylase 1
LKKVLFVAVHPDDETLGAGGTILKHKNNGDQIFWLLLSTENQRSTKIPNVVEIQRSFVKKVANEYGFVGWRQFDFLLNELDKYPLLDIVDAVSAYIKKIEPSIIYLNHFADVHSDHRVAFDAVYSCTKNFRYPFIEKILIYETMSETEFTPAVSKNQFIPNVFNDITPYMEKKLEIMKMFTTEQMEEPLPRAMSSIKALNRYRGSRIGVEYAEAFMLLYEML